MRIHLISLSGALFFGLSTACQAPDYSLAHPCIERSADAGGLSATFASPVGSSSYVVDGDGFEVAFTATCVPEGAVPVLTLATGDGEEVAVETIGGRSICEAGEPGLHGSTDWECATFLELLGKDGDDCGAPLGSTTLGIALRGAPAQDALLAEVSTPFTLIP